MAKDELRADLVLAGGGVKGIAYVGAIAAISGRGYSFPRAAGTSSGAIVAALVASGMSSDRMAEVLRGLSWERFRDKGVVDRIPLVGPLASIAVQYGVFEGDYVHDWLGALLAEQGVRTFGDLRNEGADSVEDRYRLVVMAADTTRGELIRLPWDYPRYGLAPDEQLVADAVRASVSIPIFFEPARLRAADGSVSTLVDGGVLSNFPIDVFDRTDGSTPRWPTFGITVLPKLPAGNAQLFPQLPWYRAGVARYVENLITTTIVGRDQGHLEKPWVKARAIEVDTSDVGLLEFDVSEREQAEAFENGLRAANEFLDGWDFASYKRRFRPQPTAP